MSFNLVVDRLFVDLGARIKNLRTALKLTQAQVAEIAGIDVSFFGQIERGANIPSIRTLYAIALALKAEPADLLPPIQADRKSPFPNSFFRILDDIPMEKQGFVIGMVRDIAKEFEK
jgi:transcriptional regulator with XRE-family HTH domain